MSRLTDIEKKIKGKRAQIAATELALHGLRIELESLEKLRYERPIPLTTTRAKRRKWR